MPSGVRVEVPAPWPDRIRACVCDYLVIVGWLAVLALVALALGLFAPGTARWSPLATDLVAFTCSVLPAWAYLTVTEGSVRQASWGKWWAAVRVVGPDGDPPGWRRVALRNVIKLLPWELAHVAVTRIWLGLDDPVLVWTTDALSLLIPLVSVLMAWRDPLRRALHDRVAGTRVVPGRA